MHRHGTAQSARGCSRFCATNQADREYYQKHGHYREVPRDDCLACQELKRQAEEKRRQEERQARAASKCVAAGENPAHYNSQLRPGMERRNARH